jgi:hypothetical protein
VSKGSVSEVVNGKHKEQSKESKWLKCFFFQLE